MLRNLLVMLVEMVLHHRWCSPLNFMRLFFAAHLRKKNTICRIVLRKNKHPVFVRARTMDCLLTRMVLIKKGGEYPVFVNYKPQVIIDAGANIGLATVFFKTYYPNAMVIAIEPDAENCEMFERNTKAYDRVHLLRGGLWPEGGHCLQIINPKGSSWGFQCKPAETGMPTFSVSDICARFKIAHIDIFKIDIEGNERELFSRNTGWLDITDNIFMELHDHASPGASKCMLRAIANKDYALNFSGEDLILTKQTLLWLDK